MTVGLDVIIVICLLVNAAGLTVVALMMYWRRVLPDAGPRLLSFVVGVLLGAVLLDLLPHLWEATGNMTALLAMFAAALVISWLFDNVCACSHPRVERRGAQGVHHHGKTGVLPVRGSELLLAGDFVHSLVDGALIVAALAMGVLPGAVATIAVAIHEVPRRVATATLLLRSGCPPAVVIGLAMCAGLGTVLGGGLAWWSAEAIRQVLPIALALSTAALLYVALTQTSNLLRARRTRVLLRECGLPFLAGILIIGGSHHVQELFG